MIWFYKVYSLLPNVIGYAEVYREMTRQNSKY